MDNLFERVLFATDLSPASARVFESLEGMPSLGLKQARLLYVLDVEDVSEGAAELESVAGLELEKMAARLTAQGVETDSYVMEGTPAESIAGEAAGWGATLILLGSTPRGGLTRLLVGDVALEVMHAARTPVLVERRPEAAKGRSPLERALVPVDFSDASEEVLDRVRELSGWAVKEAVLVHVVEGAHRKDTQVSETESALAGLSDIAMGISGAGAKATAHVHTGRVDKEVAGIAAEEGATVIVMGSHFRGRIKDALSGHTAERVLHASGVSVLYFPHTGPPISGGHIP